MEYLIQILASKTQQDVVETVKLIALLNKFGFESAKAGV